LSGTYAVVETGGKQYRVAPGDTVDVEYLVSETGDEITLDRVLLVAAEDGVKVGTPTVAGASVRAQVVGRDRGSKIIVFKYKNKVRSRRKTGHRQGYTRLQIQEISA
jgi:large subunit ribosomal protein L21